LLPFFSISVSVILVVGLCGFIGCVNESIPESPERVTERLVPLLQDPQPAIRRTAALSLGKIGEPEGIPALVSALSDPDDEVRQWSAWALGMTSASLSKPALVALVQCLTDPSDSVRQAVILALSRNAIPEELMRVLSKAYSISTLDTQKAIVQVFSHFEFPFSYTLFLQALENPEPSIRQRAIAGLGELGDPRGIPLLRTHLLKDTSVAVRSEAAFRLGKFGTSAEVPVLRQAMETDPTPTVHFWASWALAQIIQET
jgi:HEAT repeat protein